MTAVDLALVGGTVVDGTGAPAYRADVAVSGGRIVAVGDDIVPPPRNGADWSATRVVDVTGRIVAPGFIDVHSHSDLTLLSNPRAHSKVRQGVTTEVIGNCGLGVFPLTGSADRPVVRSAVGFIDVDPAVQWTWDSAGNYLDALSAAGPSLNVVPLVGHLPLHASVVGLGIERASQADLDRMCGLLADAFAAGVRGLSTGLVYAPLCYVAEEELLALARAVAAHDRVFAWHVRDYGDHLLDSVGQAVRVARRTGARTQVSHLIAVGRRNWGKVEQALALVDGARAQSIDVGVDVYPYIAGSANLSQLLPSWAHDGGPSVMLERIGERHVRQKIAAEWINQPLAWSEISVSGGVAAELLGRSIAQIAEASGTAPPEVVLDLIGDSANAASMVAAGRSEADVLAVLAHPAAVIGSDGLALDAYGPTGVGLPHPRSYGCYPRLLRTYVAPGRLTLEQAVHKSTLGAARRVGIGDRGSIAAGQAADLVVLDLASLADDATFADPHRYPNGIDLVIVNGDVVVDQQTHTGAAAGAILRCTPEVDRR